MRSLFLFCNGEKSVKIWAENKHSYGVMTVFQIAKVFINQYLKSAVRGGLRGQATIIQNATESIGTPNPEV